MLQFQGRCWFDGAPTVQVQMRGGFHSIRYTYTYMFDIFGLIEELPVLHVCVRKWTGVMMRPAESQYLDF